MSRNEQITEYIKKTINPEMTGDVVSFPWGGPSLGHVYYSITYTKSTNNVIVKYNGETVDEFTISLGGGRKYRKHRKNETTQNHPTQKKNFEVYINVVGRKKR